jgi:hypothetical protein
MIDTNETLIEYTPEMITRREAVARVAALLGGVALIGGSALITGCRTDRDQIPFTPGAKAAKTGELMARIVTDSYSLEDQRIFRAGMVKLDNASKDMNGGKTFMQATPEQRLALLKTLDKEQFDFSEKHRLNELKKTKEFLAQVVQENGPKTESQIATAVTDEPPNRYFRMMKELSLLGYFTSEIGCTQAQVYEEAPGRYDPCLPYTPGQKAWASHA